MKYVLDANVALKWALAEPDSAKARQLRDDFQRDIHDLLAPDLFEVEIAHALTRAERQGRIAVGHGGILWAHILSTSPRLERSGLLIPRAITISSSLRVGVYDCLYTALAEREVCEFVTADARLIRALASRFPFIVSLASLP